MKKWRIRREVEDGREWFYPEGRWLFFLWRGYNRCVEPMTEIRFDNHGDAVLWIQRNIKNDKDKRDKSYTYPFD